MSETPTPEPLKPNTEEEIAELRRRLEASDAIIRNRNQEIAALQSQLSDLQENSASAGEDFPDAADLLNQLLGKRKKSKADLADVKAILELIEGIS